MSTSLLIRLSVIGRVRALEDGAMAKVAAADLSGLPRVAKGSTRIGSPINRPTKVICVGLNYLGPYQRDKCRYSCRACHLYESSR